MMEACDVLNIIHENDGPNLSSILEKIELARMKQGGVSS